MSVVGNEMDEMESNGPKFVGNWIIRERSRGRICLLQCSRNPMIAENPPVS